MDEGDGSLRHMSLPRKAIAETGKLEARKMRPTLLMLIATSKLIWEMSYGILYSGGLQRHRLKSLHPQIRICVQSN